MKMLIFITCFAICCSINASEVSDRSNLIEYAKDVDIIIAGRFGFSASGGGGTTSTITINEIIYDPEHVINSPNISIGWATAKVPKDRSKIYLWFLKTNEDGRNSTDFSAHPLLPATVENIALLKELLTHKKTEQGAVATRADRSFNDKLTSLLAEQSPILNKYLCDTLDLDTQAHAGRVGSAVNVHFGGTGIGPYIVNAKPKGSKGIYTLQLWFHTEKQYLDVNGNVSNADRGIRVIETIRSVEIKSLAMITRELDDIRKHSNKSIQATPEGAPD